MPRKSKRTKSSNPNNGEPLEDEDRLSTLPDSLLIEIISLLPIKSAVCTSALSQRWRNLWTQLTCLTLDHRQFQGTSTNFYFIFDRIISQITSPSIHSFTLNLRDFVEPPSSVDVDSWFRNVCAKNVQLMKVGIDSNCGRDSILHLPPCVFQTHSLVHLSLVNFHKYEFPDVEINLPNLKILELFLCAPSRQWSIVSKLIRACPLLEHLFLLAFSYPEEQADVIIDISSPNLMGLVLDCDSCHESTKFVINAPNLRGLFFHGTAASSCSLVTNSGALVLGATRVSSEMLALSLLKQMFGSIMDLLIDLVALNALKGFKEVEKDGKPLVF